jgi:aminoglycoside N3'-acetyltransferase
MNYDFLIKVWYWYKKKFKIRSWELYKASIIRGVESRIYRSKYSAGELIGFMQKQGLKKGSNVLLHSSWNEFYNFKGSPNDFIDAIIEAIGPEGTLVMPAYPFLRKKESIFDIQRTPTAAGLIPEVFRNYPGVKRSVNIHSVCAFGKHADFLTRDHIHSATCWDRQSPYYRLSEIDGIVFGIGLGKAFVGTIMHTVDSLLREEIPYFAQFFTGKQKMKVKLSDGTVYEQEFLTAAEDFKNFFTDNHHYKIVDSYFDYAMFSRKRFSNLKVNFYNVNYMINRGIELGRKGIVVYIKPDPKDFIFPNQ